jgi:mannitol/fructose-specific phosphotransferase system IIA component (Ntr-type)
MLSPHKRDGNQALKTLIGPGIAPPHRSISTVEKKILAKTDTRMSLD